MHICLQVSEDSESQVFDDVLVSDSEDKLTAVDHVDVSDQSRCGEDADKVHVVYEATPSTWGDEETEQTRDEPDCMDDSLSTDSDEVPVCSDTKLKTDQH